MVGEKERFVNGLGMKRALFSESYQIQLRKKRGMRFSDCLWQVVSTTDQYVVKDIALSDEGSGSIHD